MTDDTGTPPSQPAGETATSPNGGGRTRAMIVVSVVAAAAVVGLGTFLAMALSDKGELETALAETQQDVVDLEARVADAESNLDLVRSQLDTANTQLSDARERIDDAEAKAADAEELDSLIVELLRASFFAGVGDTDQADCIVDSLLTQVGTVGLLEGVVRVVSNPFGEDPLAEEYEIAADECGVEQPPEFEAGFTYGDNPTLDALWDACAEGDGAACDTLYEISELGSEYERFGGTCGDRYATIFDAPLYCEGEI